MRFAPAQLRRDEPRDVGRRTPKSAQKHPVVLFDDVLTTGSQMIGACRRFAKVGMAPSLAFVVGRTTHEQHEKMIGWEKEQLETERARIDLRALLDRPLSDL